MDRLELIEFLKSKKILGPSGKRKSCWFKYWDNEIDVVFKEFASKYRSLNEAWFCLLKGIEPQKCEICGELAKFTGRVHGQHLGYNTVCDRCSANNVESKKIKFKRTLSNRTDQEWKEIEDKRRLTMEKLYGDPLKNLFGSESYKHRMIELYGDPYYNNREKYTKTMNDRYGVNHNFQIDGHQKRSQIKKIKTYGNVSNYEKTKITNKIKYGVEHIGQVKEFQIKSSQKKKDKITEIESKYNCTLDKKLRNLYGQGWLSLGIEKIRFGQYTFVPNEYLDAIEEYSNQGSHTNNYVSNKENDLYNYIKNIYNGIVLKNITNVAKNGKNRFYEFDIYLPDLKIAFDFNGIYWHSDKFKDKYYHQRKMIKCYEVGVQLIHIYECDWDNDVNIKCKIMEVIKDPKNGEKYGWVPTELIQNYYLTEPAIIYENDSYKVYNEGVFKKK